MSQIMARRPDTFDMCHVLQLAIQIDAKSFITLAPQTAKLAASCSTCLQDIPESLSVMNSPAASSGGTGRGQGGLNSLLERA